MRTLNPILADYADRVDFYLVAFNENAGRLEGYVAENGYSNMTATQPVGSMLRDLKVVSQSSFIGMDSSSVITFRKGYGGQSVDFRAELERMTAQ